MKLLLVDTASEKARLCLHRMQLDIFPYDSYVDITKGSWWVASAGPEELLAGFGGMHYRHQGEPLTAYLCLAGVYPEYRGRGIQRRLIRARVNKARSLGLRRVVTDTYNNPASANSLIACGFRAYMPEVPWKEDGAAYWMKDLQ